MPEGQDPPDIAALRAAYAQWDATAKKFEDLVAPFLVGEIDHAAGGKSVSQCCDAVAKTVREFLCTLHLGNRDLVDPGKLLKFLMCGALKHARLDPKHFSTEFSADDDIAVLRSPAEAWVAQLEIAHKNCQSLGNAFCEYYGPELQDLVALIYWNFQENDLDDGLQEFWCKFFEPKGPLSEYDPSKGTVLGFLMTIVGNKLKDFWRKRSRRRRNEAEFQEACPDRAVTESDTERVDDDDVHHLRLSRLNEFRAGISADNRSLFDARYKEGKTWKQITEEWNATHSDQQMDWQAIRRRTLRLFEELGG